MILSQIEKLAGQGESGSIEFKKSTAQLKAACKTICAFLNGDGGYVLFGVCDDGNILGQEVSDKSKREIGNELAKISPAPHELVNVYYVKLDAPDKVVICVQAVSDSAKRPFMYDNRAYVRHETSTIPMARDYLEQLTLANAQGDFAWDNRPCNNATIGDLDTDEILATIREGTINGRIPEGYATDDPFAALRRLDLLDGEKIKNAAVVLFGKKPDYFYPQCLLRLARFRGLDKSEFIDNKQVGGNIFKLLNESMMFANLHLPIASTFPKDQVQRVDTPLFPILALREAMANALCHRDYSNYSGSVGFAIYDDRLEIWNCGQFPAGVTLANLKSNPRSVPRNRKIANVLYYHKIFESWGRGINKIIDDCTAAGHPEPVYTQDSLGTLLTLKSKQLIGAGALPTSLSDTSAYREVMHGQKKEILQILQESGPLSTTQIREKMSSPKPAERTTRAILTIMSNDGLIVAHGQTNKRKWHLIEK